MKKQFVLWLLCLYLGLTFAYAKKAPQYIKDSKDFSTIGVDRHDLDAVAEVITKLLLDSSFIRELQGQKILAISTIHNNTRDDIDVEFLSRRIARALYTHKKLTLTNAIAGSGSSTDNLLTDSRKLTKDKRFNQYTTQEDGTLLAPDLSLSGKIIQRTKSVGDKVRVDYDFLFVLTDLKSGRVVWDSETHISKVIAKSQVARFGKLEIGTCDSGDVLACAKEAQAALDANNLHKAQDIFHQACELGSKQACENRDQIKKDIKNLREKQKRQQKKQQKAEKHAQKEAKAKNEKANQKRKMFGLSLGADVGYGFSGVNIVPIPYETTPLAGGNGHGLIHYNDDGSKTNIPYTIKAGIWYQHKYFYANVNMLYTSYQTKTTEGRFNYSEMKFNYICTGDKDYGDCLKEGVGLDGLIIDHKFLGANIRGGIAASEDKANFRYFFGIGVLRDIGSTLKSSPTSPYTINEKLNNTLYFLEIGTVVAPTKFFFWELSIKYILGGSDNKSWANLGSLNLGIGFLLPV